MGMQGWGAREVRALRSRLPTNCYITSIAASIRVLTKTTINFLSQQPNLSYYIQRLARAVELGIYVNGESIPWDESWLLRLTIKDAMSSVS